MRIHDYSNCPLSRRFYGVAEKKLGVLIDGSPYMLKFQKKTAFGFRYNTISEYLGSHIYKLLGFYSQETFLGTYQGENVVACKDFTEGGFQFVPFNDVGESTIEEDKDKYQYSYEDIVSLLMSNKKLTNVEETVASFFEVFIVDALIGNFDRHGGNWGFLKKDNRYRMAPVFDNGSCLFPNMTDEDEMRLIIGDESLIDMRVYKFPTSQIKLDGQKSSYFEVISSLRFERMNEALLKIYPRINLGEINSLIDEVEILTDMHKQFYKTILRNRYEKILKHSYLKLTERKP